MHLVRPHHTSLLPSTVHNTLACVNIAHIYASGHALSISVKPGSAAHLPTSTASIGLQHLLVAAHVHLVWFRAVSHHVWPSPCTNVLHTSHMEDTCEYVYQIWSFRTMCQREVCTDDYADTNADGEQCQWRCQQWRRTIHNCIRLFRW